MVPPLLVLALEFHRAPLRFRHLTDPQGSLPDAFGDWLTESSAALGPANIEATAEALGSAPEALRDAFLFLLRHILLLPSADHYRVLALPRRCSSEAIKQHHGLLIRLFHPDRAPENDEWGASLTVRINTAYQILRDPDARRRYDRRLPSLPKREGLNDDPSRFFRPDGPVVPVPRRAASASALPSRARPVLFWTVGVAGLMALVYAAVREPRQPLLLVNPELAGGPTQGPSYMQGSGLPTTRIEPEGQAGSEPSWSADRGSPQTVPTVVSTGARDRPEETEAGSAADEPAPVQSLPGRQAPDAASPRATPGAEAIRKATKASMSESAAAEAVTLAPSRPAQTSGRREGPKDTRAALDVRERHRDTSPARADHDTGSEPTGAQAASGVVRRLERSFANGDLAGLVNLFAANAVVNAGVGALAVGNGYSDLIRHSDDRRMAISGLSWRTGRHQRLVGRGAIRISTKRGSQRDWSEAAGTVEIELVPWMGEYRIAKLIHSLSRK
jgi:hypothetical protein